MATKNSNNPTANLFALLQAEGGEEKERNTSAAAPKATGAALTPAEKARARQAAQAEKESALKKQREEEASRKQAEAAFVALVGPLDGFQTQKTGKKDKAVEKKKKEDFLTEKNSPNQGRKFDGEKKEKKPFDPTQKKAPRQQQDGEKKPFARDGEKKHHAGHQEQHHGNRPPKRDFDKHSAGKTGRHFEAKKGGEGHANWGNPVNDAKEEVVAADVNKEEEKVGWGDETPAAEGASEKKTEEAAAPAEPAKPSWDDEGFGKMTLAEYQAKVAAAKAAELAEKVGTVQPRKIENADLSKFVEKDTTEEKYAKKAEKKDKKQTGPARSGEKPVELQTVFDFNGRGGRGGRGGRQQQGGRQNSPKPLHPKQFPDLLQANKPSSK